MVRRRYNPVSQVRDSIDSESAKHGRRPNLILAPGLNESDQVLNLVDVSDHALFATPPLSQAVWGSITALAILYFMCVHG